MIQNRIVFTVVIAAMIFTAQSCLKNKKENLNSEQQALLERMNVSYSMAKAYNDSLVNCSASEHPHAIFTNLYDSCYHVNDSLFSHCHLNMMNTMNNGMMNGGGTMMNNGGHQMCNTGNDELNNVIRQMNNLREIHLEFHP